MKYKGNNIWSKKFDNVECKLDEINKKLETILNGEKKKSQTS